MPNDSYSQQALASYPNFQTRVRSALGNVAWQVLGEDPATPFHAERWTFAKNTINNLQATTPGICFWIVERPNVLNFATSYSFPAGAVVTASGDADLESQLLTDWNMLAGVMPTAPGP